MNKKFVIAIDGPVAAGKGTIAKKVAEDLQGFYLYTGAMYRSLALYCLEKEIDLSDVEGILKILPQISFSFQNERIFVNGTDYTERIKEQDVANGASIVAVLQAVREQMVIRQQALAKEAIVKGNIVVLEGRDTATKVFPDAALKVFLTATAEVRAKRRFEQYLAQGRQTTFEEVLDEIAKRDKRDQERAVDPLPADPSSLGYFVLDNGAFTEEQTVHTIHEELQRRGLV